MNIKMTIAKENGADGEIANMRAEIHRMNVNLFSIMCIQQIFIQFMFR